MQQYKTKKKNVLLDLIFLTKFSIVKCLNCLLNFLTKILLESTESIKYILMQFY